jgi:hypothetical protein
MKFQVTSVEKRLTGDEKNPVAYKVMLCVRQGDETSGVISAKIEIHSVMLLYDVGDLLEVTAQ